MDHLGWEVDIDNGETMCVGAGAIWEISVPSAQFSSEPKTALKIINFFKS